MFSFPSNLVRSVVFACALILGACATDKAPPPLANDAQIAAAETAPANSFIAPMNTAYAPFRVIGNIYYIGTSGISAFLIKTPGGLILLDGGLPQTAPLILTNIKTLGFNIRDVKYLLNSHAHYDHAGGLAALQRASGALFAASEKDKPILESGKIDYGPAAEYPFAPVRVDRVIQDAEQIKLGGVTLTAVLTPGHTAGCTSWMMKVRGPGGAKHEAFFHCSSSVAGQSLAPESYPGMVQDYRSTFARVRNVKADVFLASHGDFFDLKGKYKRLMAGDANAFVDPEGLQRFNASMEQAFEADLAKQQAAASVKVEPAKAK